MKDFKELYEQAIEAIFSGELHKILYENELTNERLSKENRDAFRNLFQRYKDLHQLGDAEFKVYGTVAITHIIEHVDEPDMYECCSCGADLKDFTRYCPHCGRLNIDFKEEN